MRRFLSVMAVLVLLLSLSVSAFASGGKNSISLAPPQIEEGSAKNEAGEAVDVTVSEFKPEAGETVETVAQSALEAAKELPAVSGEDVTVAEVFDIDLTNGDGSSLDSPITVTFVRDTSSGDVAAVMYQKADGTWDSATFTTGANGALTVTFEHFCTVVIVTKAVEPSGPVNPTPTPGGSGSGSGSSSGSGSGSTGGSGSGSPTSPKTGFDASAWIFAMAALTACAAFCFVRAGKKSN